MIHPHTELRYIGPEIGFGVVATRSIPRGTVTWALDKLDREFTPARIASMEEPFRAILETYCYRNRKGRFVLCWDHGRFVNHSFRSNCITTAYNFEIAVRDIQAGEELTDDYGYLNISEPFRPVDEGMRRKVVYPDDLKRHHKTWDRQLREAMKRFRDVDQPLLPILPATVRRACDEILDGRREMDSILDCYYPGG